MLAPMNLIDGETKLKSAKFSQTLPPGVFFQTPTSAKKSVTVSFLKFAGSAKINFEKVFANKK